MAQISGVFRLGRDAELRRTPSGDPVANIALAFNYGRKDDSGKRPVQWIEASIWGQRAESLSPYLLKGDAIYAVLSDPHIETYQKSGGGGEGFKLVARVLDVELIGGQREQQPSQQQAPRQQAPARNAYADQKGGAPRQATAGGASGFDDMDDVPF
jgi:single-strand DNA-binding protein